MLKDNVKNINIELFLSECSNILLLDNLLFMIYNLD